MLFQYVGYDYTWHVKQWFQQDIARDYNWHAGYSYTEFGCRLQIKVKQMKRWIMITDITLLIWQVGNDYTLAVIMITDNTLYDRLVMITVDTLAGITDDTLVYHYKQQVGNGSWYVGYDKGQVVCDCKWRIRLWKLTRWNRGCDHRWHVSLWLQTTRWLWQRTGWIWLQMMH